MSEFHSFKTIKAVRKPHECEQCGKKLSVGDASLRISGRYEGEFYSYHLHPECHEAATEYAQLHGLHGEDWPWFQHGEYWDREDKDWMREHHPAVADRLGWEEVRNDA